MAIDCLIPDWPAPARVRALQTTRQGGVSQGRFASLNLGDHVGDDQGAVDANRRLLSAQMPGTPYWLQQVHGVEVATIGQKDGVVQADAAVSDTPGKVAVVMTADCLPVLLCDRSATVVAAAHAGWRGLCAGILEATVNAMGPEPGQLMAWLGPAIGPDAFEVGDEVRTAFVQHDAAASQAFRPGRAGHCYADLYRLARQRLNAAGVTAIHGGGECTYSNAKRYFSYRRDGQTGRMGTFIWLDV